MRRSSLLTAAAMTAIGMAALALAAPAGAETVAIVGGHVWSMGPAGEIVSGTVLIKDGKIIAVGADIAVPAGARVIDAKGAVVTPGFVSADTGLSETEVGLDEDAAELGDMTAGPGDGTRDLQTTSPRFSAAFDVQYALNPASTLIPLARLAGVTSAVILPEYGGGRREGPREALFAGQAAAIDLGQGPELLLKPHVAMVMAFGESGADHAGGSRNAEVLELKETLAEVRHYMQNKAAYEKNQTRPFSLSQADLEALIPVIEGRLPVLVAVHRASDIRLVLKLAREEKLKVILAGVDEGWLVAGEIAAAHVPVVVDPKDDLPASFEQLAANMENAARLQAAGVEVIVGGDSENYRVRELRYLAGDAVAYGLPWEAALKAVTIAPAKAFGLADRVGSLEPGKDADVVVWSGDPFEPMSQPAAILVKGEVQPLTSRQLKLRDRYKDLSRPYPPEYH